MQTEGAYILIPGPIRRGITNIVLCRILLLMRFLGALHGASDALMIDPPRQDLLMRSCKEKQGTSRNIRNLKNIVGINVPSMFLLCS